jgi:hypothetical protein
MITTTWGGGGGHTESRVFHVLKQNQNYDYTSHICKI